MHLLIQILMNKLPELSRWQITNYVRQTEIRNKQKLEGLRQEAVSALPQQEQEITQQRAQDHAQAAAQIQQIERQAQGFINEAQGAIYEVRTRCNAKRKARERDGES